MSARNHSMPCSSTFAHNAGGRRMDRNTMTSSGGFGGLPRGRFASSMQRTVAPIYRGTNIPCNPDLACYDKSMNIAPAKLLPAWRAVTYKAGKSRAVDRHWVVGPERQRVGFFPSFQAAEQEAERLNKRAAGGQP